MAQTILSLVLEVEPQRVGRVREILLAWRAAEEGSTPKYSRLAGAVPGLHFISAAVFPDGRYDPILAVEANFDVPAAQFWAQLEAATGEMLRDLVRCCKRPADGTREVYDRVTAVGSRDAVAAYLGVRAGRPMIFHQGNRGMGTARIQRERALFLATRGELDGPLSDGVGGYHEVAAEAVHARLRAALLPAFPWLGEAAGARIGVWERVRDWWNLAGFLVLLVLALSVPGIALAAFAHGGLLLLWIVVAAAVAWWGVNRISDALPGQAAPRESGALKTSSRSPMGSLANTTTSLLAVAAFVAVYLFAVSWVLAGPVSLLTGARFGAAWHGTARALLLGLASVAATVPLVLLWLRWLERRDSSQDGPVVLPENRAALARLEDKVAQNHMGSLVMIKPGMLRTALVWTGLWGLGLVLRVVATAGYLGSMRTIHFAHWAMANNGSRLLFFSNFDGSWESYLDDFIEKAHGGLSLAWGCCVGFPPGRFLVLDGASHGRRFKAWARASMAPTLFWYSAYPDLTVNQIERNAAVAEGLRRPEMRGEEALKWAGNL